MENKLNISRFPNLKNLIDSLVARLNLDWSKKLDLNINLEVKDIECIHSGQIMPMMEKSMVVVDFNMDYCGKYAKKFNAMFSYNNAVTISGARLKEEPATIRERFDFANMGTEYSASFLKFCTETAKSLDNVFNSNLPEQTTTTFEGHLISPKDNNKLEEMFPLTGDNQIFCLKLEAGLLDFDDIALDLFFPIELVEAFFGETVYSSTENVKGRILVVDDSKADVAIIRKFMRNSNYVIVESNDEQSTLRQLFTEKVRLVLLDIYLANENGLSICRRIRRNMLCDRVPIVMYSCGATRDNIVKSLRVGAQDFIAKPFTKELLLKKLHNHLENDRNL